jgi:microcystin-dependent protein
LPDFRGRVPIGYGAGPNLSPYQLAARGGYEGVSLDLNTLPSHTHAAQLAGSAVSVTLKASPAAGTETIPGTNGATTIAASSAGRSPGSFIYNNQSATVDLNGVAVSGGVTGVVNGPTGGGLAHENRQPYLAINFIIALQGLYPMRP